jgi:hypothetical protein
MLRKILLFLFLLASLSGYASHLRSGEISYQAVPGMPNTFLITFTIYTNVASSTADVNTLPVSLGDGSNPTLTRINGSAGFVNGKACTHIGELITPLIRKNIFTVQHTFPANRSFTISTSPTARNAGIVNMSGSLTANMYIDAMLTTSLTPMNSPELTFPPIDDGCLNYIYKINPGAIDPDGDVLSFQLVRCKTAGGADIPSFKYPDELDPSTTFKMDSKTGIIT